ncbi:MAG: MBL fold metallo-hydrolase [Promethearchaeota archaeon]
MDISILKFGTLSLEYKECFTEELYNLGKYLGKAGDSAVIHIENEGKHYLVDTGYANESDFSQKNINYNEINLRNQLKLYNLKFEDISGIFITHWHADHFANLPLFPNAKIYCYNPKKMAFNSIAERFKFEKLLPVISLNIGDEFAGCKLFPTPGHTQFHCSLLLDFWNLKIIIAGDAIVSQSYFDHDEVWPYNTGNLGDIICKNSMKKIIEVADYILPGHGHPFQNYKKIKD